MSIWVFLVNPQIAILSPSQMLFCKQKLGHKLSGEARFRKNISRLWMFKVMGTLSVLPTTLRVAPKNANWFSARWLLTKNDKCELSNEARLIESLWVTSLLLTETFSDRWHTFWMFSPGKGGFAKYAFSRLRTLSREGSICGARMVTDTLCVA